MLAEYKTKTNIGVGVGFILQLVSRFMAQQLGSLALVIGLVGFVFFIYGCASYAKGKGYSPWLGALGILSIIGLIILVLIPDKHKAG